MANPLFNALSGGKASSMPGPMDQFGQMMQQFQQFKANFQGDPKQEVQKLLQSGRMSQDQLNQLQAMALALAAMVRGGSSCSSFSSSAAGAVTGAAIAPVPAPASWMATS